MDDTSISLKKYLQKLSRTIEYEATFTLINVKLVNKARIDDILCCIEASFPESYKQVLKRADRKKYTSYACYMQLLASIKRKFPLSSSLYAVQFKEVNGLIGNFLSRLSSDMKMIENLDV